MVEGTAPLNTAVACLPILFRTSVKPMHAASWSTDGLLLTVTKTLLALCRRSITCCLAFAAGGGAGFCGSIFLSVFVLGFLTHKRIINTRVLQPFWGLGFRA